MGVRFSLPLPFFKIMKYAIVGSRTFNNFLLLDETMKKFTDVTEIVSGGAKGADSLGEQWAKAHNIPITIYYPEWDKYGKSAGIKRNYLIVRDADFIVVFWDGKSRGTKNSIDLTKRFTKPYLIVQY